MSTESLRSNQLQLYFSSLAYVLVEALRRVGLAETEWAEYQVETIRLRLLKIAAQVRITARKIWIRYSKAYAWKNRLRPGLGRFALLKETSRDKNFVPFSSIRCSVPQASRDHEPRLAAMWKSKHRKQERRKVNPLIALHLVRKAGKWL
jgi:hypothetical protein